MTSRLPPSSRKLSTPRARAADAKPQARTRPNSRPSVRGIGECWRVECLRDWAGPSADTLATCPLRVCAGRAKKSELRFQGQ